MKRTILAPLATWLFVLAGGLHAAEPRLKLNEQGYFEAPGLDVTVFADIYPDGHQTGVTVIQHGERVAANGDLRLEPSPGQWSPVPATWRAQAVPARVRPQRPLRACSRAWRSRSSFSLSLISSPRSTGW